MSEPKPPTRPAGLVSIDTIIDEIARKALEEAKKREEAEKQKRQSNPRDRIKD